MQPTRHLTPSEKAHELEQWFGMLMRHRWQRAGARKLDSGLPDADMVPWCMRLNRLPGVCTVQSCAGHRRGRYVSSGHLWLRLDSGVAAAFEEHASDLAARPGIEQVSTIHRKDGQAIASVYFAGNERDSLAISMKAICSFFEQIARSD